MIRDLVRIQIPPCRLFFVASSLLPHLTRFLAHRVGRFCFCLVENLTVGLTIGDVVSMAGEVVVGLSG